MNPSIYVKSQTIGLDRQEYMDVTTTQNWNFTNSKVDLDAHSLGSAAHFSQGVLSTVLASSTTDPHLQTALIIKRFVQPATSPARRS